MKRSLIILLLQAPIFAMDHDDVPASNPTRLAEQITEQLFSAIHDKAMHYKLEVKANSAHNEDACVGSTSIFCSQINGRIDSALTQGANPNLPVTMNGSRIGNRSKQTPLYLACKKLGRFETRTITMLLRYNGDPNIVDKLPLLSLLVIKAQSGRTPIVMTNINNLLHAGADPNMAGADGQSPMQLAQESGLLDLVALFEAAIARRRL